MKKVVCAVCAAAVIFFGGNIPLHARAETSTGAAEVLIEARTGQVLYSKNADERLPMASITKAMALLIWAEMLEDETLSLDEKVKASSYASSAEGSVIWLNAGEELTAAELLESVIISSANDACIALAEHTAGSEAQFVKLMNKKAKELELKNTHYENCVGFDAEGHYSTAYDTAVILSELMEYDVYRGWMLTWMDYLRGGETQLVNTNKMVRYYDGILGGKTGTTDGAGCCLTVCAERGDMRLVACALGCKSDDDRFAAAERLLDYGFGSFEKFAPEIDNTKLLPIKVRRGTEPTAEPMVKSGGGECVIRKGSAGSVKYEYTFVEEVEAPVKKGQFLGEYLVTVGGTEVFRSEIVAEDDIPRMDFWRCLGLVFTEFIKM